MERTRNYGNCSFVYPQTKEGNLHKPAIKRRLKSYNHRGTIGFAMNVKFSFICSRETVLGETCRQIEI